MTCEECAPLQAQLEEAQLDREMLSDAAFSDVVRLEAERDRMAEALSRIAARTSGLKGCYDIAERALSGNPQEEAATSRGGEGKGE
jgi:hypothetical protein